MEQIAIKILSGFFISIASLSFSQTCSDGIQNGSETGIDCGGSCPACTVTPCSIELTYALGGIPPPPVVYTMTNNPVNTCFGSFYDPGGPAANYGNNQSFTQTICSDDPLEQISVEFITFQLESSFDFLSIYDGNSLSSPQISTFSGSSIPGIITSTNGCLTFNFTTDGSVTYGGWEAEIYCGLQTEPTLECLGGEILLTASGQGASYLALENDFDLSNAGSGWSSNVTASFNNPCDPSIDGGVYMWMGSSSPHPRIIETIGLDLSCGGQICFYLDFATQGAPTPCEGIDLANEGVYFDYSIDNGTNWVTIEYFGPAGVGNSTSGGGTNPQMTSWNQYCYNIPAAAETSNTKIRWAQTGSSGNLNDHWGLDNVSITSVADCTPYWYDYAQIPPAIDLPVQVENITITTTYTVTYTNGNDACSTSIIVPVAPCPCPNATLSGGGDYCFGDSIPDVIFDVVGGNFPISLTYAIDGVAQPILALSNSTYSIFNPTEGEFSILAVTDSSSCLGTFNGTISVTENPLPQFLSISAGDTYCFGDVIENIVVQGNGMGDVTVGYSLDGVIQTPMTGATSIDLGAAAGVYQLLELADSTGCFISLTNSETIVVNPIPVASVSTTTPVICAGSAIVLEANSATGNYNWTGPNAFSSMVEDPTLANGAVNQSGTYTLTITENGCTSPPASVNVLVNPIPVVTANLNESICIGTPFVLTAQGAASYSWDNGVVNGVSFIPSATQIYTVTGTTNGCSSTASVAITVLPLPVADASANVTSGYQPLSVVFQNLSLNASAYSWDLGNGIIIPSITPGNVSTIYGNIGVYYVVLTATNGICNDTWTDSIVVIPYPAIQITVPNVFSPNNDGANDVYFMDVINGKSFEATIFNRWGNKIYEINTLNAGWDGTVDGTPASDGVYFVKYSAVGMDDTLKEGQAFFHLIR